ncbi:hypothetical protein J2S66_002016 [Saccharothrix longispora]|uniref:Transposase of IS4/5 family DUF4096 n=1 Tax=Saccharothrix longispora TaxID=33920 RepID=A0ABU1PSK6_9PSEU|nr:hypothetical protein [Saccharothrix longispora]
MRPQTLCSALPDQTWPQRPRRGFHRYATDSTWYEL